MTILQEFLGLFFIFQAISAKVDNNKNDTVKNLTLRDAFLKNHDSLKTDFRMYHPNSTVDEEEPSSRMFSSYVLNTVANCAQGLLGWGCGACGWRCSETGEAIRELREAAKYRPSFPRDTVNYVTPGPHPSPGASVAIVPNVDFIGYIWGRIRISAAQLQQNCFLFNNCRVPENKRHENHNRPSAGRRRRR
ncbi:hypothetical protein ILUMI_04505 [Ignelater luminosus]|uniref:Uncharacterized protein n=1 Tax=Ignelater luminosus TaxID=2038154 RepID=A0A8K0GHB1_IGNLU|nr:hypothetical protein ILUMI_04505 [Ignelater luminosus]